MVYISRYLYVFDARTDALYASSGKERADRSVDIFIKSQRKFRNGEIIIRAAWGAMIRRSVWNRVRPSAKPASGCPTCTPLIPARHIAARWAAAMRLRDSMPVRSEVSEK